MKDAWGPTKTILRITMAIGRVDNAASGADGGCGGEGGGTEGGEGGGAA